MLIHFSAENFRSIRDAASISLIATSLLEDRASLIRCRHAKYGALPVVAFYGGNASGKSNVLRAIAFMRSLVLHSFKQADIDTAIGVKPFLLDDQSRHQPSTFVLDFVMRDTRYQLGFSVTHTHIVEEWLYAYPKRSRQVLYHRSVDADTEFYFGRALAGRNRQIQSITPLNALFVSTAAASKHPLLTDIWHYFKDQLMIRLSPSELSHARLAQELASDDHLLSEATKYLAMADTGILDIRIESQPIEQATKARLTELFEVIGKLAGDNVKTEAPDMDRRIQLGHVGTKSTNGKNGKKALDGATHYLPFEQESLGTQYLLSLLPALLDTLKNGKVLVLDEITTTLHTHIARCLVKLFTSKEQNPQGAQLIFSTHDTNLLAPGLLRRDETWLTDKSADGATTVTPLSSYKTKITDNIERGYLQGRFGAVPYLRGKLKNDPQT